MEINGVKGRMLFRTKGLSAFGAEAHSSGELKFSSSQPTLSYRVGPKSEAITPFNFLTPQENHLPLTPQKKQRTNEKQI